ncbi:MAG: UvrB/UvrC motif-containing protein [Planctomycetota bacterium]
MKYKCDNCDNPATVHMTEVIGGQKVEKHLCEECAAEEGLAMKSEVPISQLLEDFILQSGPAKKHEHEPAEQESGCDVCGLTFQEFQQQAVLGCPHDYDAFADQISELLERTQEGATEHVGKVPHRADQAQKKHNAILRLRAELKGAIAAEDYERAADLRDQIKDIEGS